MYRLGAVSIPCRRNAARALSLHGFSGCSGGRDRRVRERSSAHPAESILRAVVVSAMGAADVHGLKHISIFGWQKGCCCWPELKGQVAPGWSLSQPRTVRHTCGALLRHSHPRWGRPFGAFWRTVTPGVVIHTTYEVLTLQGENSERWQALCAHRRQWSKTHRN